MSTHKYANLPDIDTAPDIYETEDVFPSSHTNNGDSSDEESAPPARSGRTRAGDGAVGKDELDSSHLISTQEASKKFRRAERRRERPHYAYPESPTSPTLNAPHSATRPVPLSHRLRALQAELASLETELADPSNPLLHKEREENNVDPGELIRGLVDVRGRLAKISKGKEGRGKLVSVLTGEEDILEANGDRNEDESESEDEEVDKKKKVKKDQGNDEVPNARSVVEMDKRVGELEKLVGSSSTALDEASTLPPPLLPLLTRLNAQLTLLTQPRHIDSISRRLKLLLSDLDRVSSTHTQHRRQPSHPASASTPASASSVTHDQLMPLLTRLGPALPHIPHILTRLRTLSALHTSAAEFSRTLEGLEEEQRRTRDALGELDNAVETIGKSLEENRGVVKGNVEALDERVDGLLRRLEELNR